MLSHVLIFATPWTAAHQASLSFTNSQSLLKLMSIESVMPSNHLILCHPLLLLPSSQILHSIHFILFQTCSLTITWWMEKKISLSYAFILISLICIKCINFFQKASCSDVNWIFYCLPSQLRYLMARTLPAFESLDCNPVSGTQLLLVNAY